MRAADQADQRRLAGTVGADQPEYLSRGQRETDIVDGNQSGEMPRRITNFQDGFHSR